jgi:hypothetical protein
MAAKTGQALSLSRMRLSLCGMTLSLRGMPLSICGGELRVADTRMSFREQVLSFSAERLLLNAGPFVSRFSKGWPCYADQRVKALRVSHRRDDGLGNTDCRVSSRLAGTSANLPSKGPCCSALRADGARAVGRSAPLHVTGTVIHGSTAGSEGH